MNIKCECLYVFNDVFGTNAGVIVPDPKYPDIYYCKGDEYSERRAKLRLGYKELINRQRKLIDGWKELNKIQEEIQKEQMLFKN